MLKKLNFFEKMSSKFAKKSLGQNFLNSSEVRSKILFAAGDLRGKKILEIGPGLGFLTTKLLGAGADLTAVEADERAIEILNKDFAQKSNFHLIHGDILRQDLDKIFEQKKYSVIANIPYNITAPILRKLLAETRNRPDFAILMVQKEVAEKIVGSKISRVEAGESSAGTTVNPRVLSQKSAGSTAKKRSILSISVEIFAESKILFFVPRENFSPAPRVDSAVIFLKIRDKSLVPDGLERDFFTVVNAGFSEKRKKIGNVLPKFFGIGAGEILGEVDPNLRPEDLSIADWVGVARNFGGIFSDSRS